MPIADIFEQFHHKTPGRKYTPPGQQTFEKKQKEEGYVNMQELKRRQLEAKVLAKAENKKQAEQNREYRQRMAEYKVQRKEKRVSKRFGATTFGFNTHSMFAPRKPRI